MAQENSKQREVGVVFSSFDNFGLTYKTGTEKSLWRFTSLLISGRNTKEVGDSLENNQNNIGFGIKFGKEYRKVIVKNLELRYGADLSFSYNHSTSKNVDISLYNIDLVNEQTIYQPGINLVIGLNYVIKDRFVIGAELLPYFSYITGKYKRSNFRNDEIIESDISGFLYGLSNTSALLSLSYRL